MIAILISTTFPIHLWTRELANFFQQVIYSFCVFVGQMNDSMDVSDAQIYETFPEEFHKIQLLAEYADIPDGTYEFVRDRLPLFTSVRGIDFLIGQGLAEGVVGPVLK